MDLTLINEQIEAAYAAATENPVRVMPYEIAPNVTLQTDTYVAPVGTGFRVVCRITIPEVNYTVSRVKNYGSDTASECGWPEEGIEAAARAHVVKCIYLGKKWVEKHGFDADAKVILFNKLLKVKESGTVQNYPKLTTLYGWMEAVTTMAISGRTNFMPPEYSFEDALMEL